MVAEPSLLRRTASMPTNDTLLNAGKAAAVAGGNAPTPDQDDDGLPAARKLTCGLGSSTLIHTASDSPAVFCAVPRSATSPTFGASGTGSPHAANAELAPTKADAHQDADDDERRECARGLGQSV